MSTAVSVSNSDLDIATAATELSVSKKFVRDLIASGRLPAYRVAGSRVIRIRRADLDAIKQPVLGVVV